MADEMKVDVEIMDLEVKQSTLCMLSVSLGPQLVMKGCGPLLFALLSFMFNYIICIQTWWFLYFLACTF